MIIFFTFPHLGYDFILYKLAKVFNIKTILMYPTIVPNKYFMVKNLEELGNFDERNINKLGFENIIKLKNLRDNYIKEQKENNLKFLKKSRRIKIDKRLIKKIILKFLIKLKLIYRDDINNQQKLYNERLNKIEKSFEEIKRKRVLKK